MSCLDELSLLLLLLMTGWALWVDELCTLYIRVLLGMTLQVHRWIIASSWYCKHGGQQRMLCPVGTAGWLMCEGRERPGPLSNRHFFAILAYHKM